MSLRRRLIGLGCVAAAALSTAVGIGPASASVTTPLRYLPRAHDVYIGSATTVDELNLGQTFQSTLGREFNMVTPGNDLKWETTEPQRGVFDYTKGDQVVAFAKQHRQTVRGHTFIWHWQLPGWLTGGGFGAAELGDVLDNHIANEAGHYRGQLYSWDVVNEPFNEDGTYRQTMWYDTLGPSYIARALRDTRAADRHAKLYLNDYNVEGINPKSDALYNLVKSLKQQGVPIDGVGLQAHYVLGTVPTDIKENIKRFVDLGVEVAITEMDVRIKLPATPADLQQQAADYATITRACLAVKRCVSVTIWGVTDASSWVPGVFAGYGAALPFDENYNPKPAYYALADAYRECRH
jgi:endo-1,4-beta-xylanase